MGGPAWGELPPNEPGKIYWWRDAPPTHIVSASGGGRWWQNAQFRAEEPKEKKRGGILGIFVRPRIRGTGPEERLAKRIVQDAMRRQLEHERWEMNQPYTGPQAIQQGAEYMVPPQVFEAPPSGNYDAQGRWHDDWRGPG